MARRASGRVALSDLRNRLGTTVQIFESWLYLAPSVDRAAGTVRRDEAVLILLAVRLQQRSMRPGAVRLVLAELLKTIDDPLRDDWVVVKRPRSRATIHLRELIDLKMLWADQSVGVFDAAELRQLAAG